MELYVRGLSPSIDDRQLRQLFQPFGPSRVKVVRDRETGQGRGFGYVTIDNEKQACQAIREMHGRRIEARQLQVSEARARGGNERRPNQGQQPGPQGGRNARPQPYHAYTSPYTFKDRPAPEKTAPERLHHQLNQDCFDIAFEVEWKALTPVAANPCSEGQATCPVNNNKEFQGYDKRWLMVDDKLAISPFTVKSAIANGVAALLGSCYRVESKIVSHAQAPAHFPYTGVWKRYRVAMDNSLPGILKDFDHTTGEVSVWPVTEYFYDQATAPAGIGTFVEEKRYYVTAVSKKKKMVITRISGDSFPGSIEVLYVGLYRFGMNLSLGPGKLGKRWYHRFYRMEPGSSVVKGQVKLFNLLAAGEQKNKVYMGKFAMTANTVATDRRTSLTGGLWHQDLSRLRGGEWIYYQCVQENGLPPRITAIGLNFQFKTAFHLHDDTLPEGQKTCTAINHLCPRCAMFGMTEEETSEGKAGGLRGRFKSAALTGPKIEEGNAHSETIAGQSVLLLSWTSENEEVARQFLLPIQGQAKANKRDVNGGYYAQGLIRGAKEYLHSGLSYQDLGNECQRVHTCKTLRDYHGPDEFDLHNTRDGEVARLEYTHSQRNYAMVCKEGLSFSGTLGVENCSVQEAAALLLLLEHPLAHHGFKIGLGKSMGLGSMTSTINKVWLKQAADQPWDVLRIDRHPVPVEGAADQPWDVLPGADGQPWLDDLQGKVDGLKEAMTALRAVQEQLNTTQKRGNRRLKYPPPLDYWGKFRRHAV